MSPTALFTHILGQRNSEDRSHTVSNTSSLAFLNNWAYKINPFPAIIKAQIGHVTQSSHLYCGALLWKDCLPHPLPQHTHTHEFSGAESPWLLPFTCWNTEDNGAFMKRTKATYEDGRTRRQKISLSSPGPPPSSFLLHLRNGKKEETKEEGRRKESCVGY